MGITVNGAGSNPYAQGMKGMLTIKNPNHANVQMAAMRSTAKKKKKPLNYNHREISGQILRAKKMQSAATAVTRAKSKLAMLQRCAGTGQYDQKEVANALAHAKRMVRCAQMKVQNLKEEEQERKDNRKKSGSEEQQRENEVKRRVAAREREIKHKMAMQEMQAVVREKSRRQELARKRRIHRNEERAKIMEADMKYLKGQMEREGSSEGTNVVADTGVFVEISASASALAEAARAEALMSQQLEQQIEMEVEAELAMEMGDVASVSGGISSGAVTDAGSALGAADTGAVSVGVSV